jgi:hypothetical protein
MDYYLVKISGSNSIWKKNIVFHEGFFNDNEEIILEDVCNNFNKYPSIFVKALNPNGETVLLRKDLVKKEFPPFFDIDRAIIIKKELLDESIIKDFNDILLLDVYIKGDFDIKYSLLFFKERIDCVNFENSTFNKYQFTLPTLERSKIPKFIDGFYLSDWNNNNKSGRFRYYNIVSEKLKNQILKLDKANVFFEFSKISFAN